MDKEQMKRQIENNFGVMKALLDMADSDKRDLTAAETVLYETLDKANDEMQRDIDGNKAHIPNWRSGNGETALFSNRRTWEQVFGRSPKPLQRKLNLAEIIQAVHSNDVESLRELRTLNIGNDSQGGYSVPEPMWSSIYNSALEVSVTLDLVTVFPMTAKTLTIPAWDSETHTSGPIAAVEGQWLGETAAATRVTPALRSITLSAWKLAMYIAASSEVLQDSIALQSSLGPLMRNSLSWSIDEAILTGDGVGKPLGITQSPCRVAVTRATANQVALGDLADMYGRLVPSSAGAGRAVWLMSPAAFAYCLDLETTGGQLVMLATPGATGRLPMTLFGAPIRITEKLPTLGQEGDICLCDLSYYALGTRETGRFETTVSAQWTQDITDFRFIWRLDGQPLIDAPLVPANGGDSLSPFVVLS